MILPIDLLLVRHGESEGNAAELLAKAGDDSAMRELRKKKCNSDYLLTDKGRTEAQDTGYWLLENFYKEKEKFFDCFFASPYLRATETAAHLGLPNAEWLINIHLREWEFDAKDFLNEDGEERHTETFSTLCLRIHHILDMLSKECRDKRVIIVCHGGVMWAFRMILERMPQERFKELFSLKELRKKIFNGQIIHYTRRDPVTENIAEDINWVRMIRPGSAPLWDTLWQEIEKPKLYSNEEILKEFDLHQ